MLAHPPAKVGHVSFLGLLNHTQMRALTFLRHSQLSGFERAVKHPSGLVPGLNLELPMHVSTGPLRSVPGYAFPFTEQTEHIQKRARLQPVGCAFMLTPDAGDSAAIYKHFSGFEFFLLPSIVHARPSASTDYCSCQGSKNN